MFLRSIWHLNYFPLDEFDKIFVEYEGIPIRELYKYDFIASNLKITFTTYFDRKI